MIADYPHNRLADSLALKKRSFYGPSTLVREVRSTGGEFSDLLDSIRISLDKMFLDKRFLIGSQEVAQNSNFSEEDEEEFKLPLSPKINTLLEMMNVCMNKLAPTSPTEEVSGSSSNRGSELLETCPPNLLSRGSVPNIASEDRSLFSNTFGRRRSNIPSFRERTGSLASMTSVSTFASTANSTPRSSTYITSQPLKQLVLVDVYLNAAHKGWLSKQYVPQSSFLLRKTWKKRFFVLNGTCLYRFKSNSEFAQSGELFRLTPSCSVCVTDDFPGKKFVLQITESINNSVLHLMAESSEDLSNWLSCFKDAIIRSRFEQEVLPPSPAVSHCDYPSLDSRRSSAQTLPITFQNSPEPSRFAPTRLSRANSQPAVQTFPIKPTTSSNQSKAKHLSQQNSTPATPTSTPSTTTPTPIAGRLSNITRLRNSGSARLSSANGSRRPSLAPLQEQDADDSDFLQEVLSPFNHRSSTFLGLFSQPPTHTSKQ